MQLLKKTTTLAIAAASAGFAVWRRYKYCPVELRELELFDRRLSRASNKELERLRTDFEILAAFDSNREFRKKREACRAEVNRRAGGHNRI